MKHLKLLAVALLALCTLPALMSCEDLNINLNFNMPELISPYDTVAETDENGNPVDPANPADPASPVESDSGDPADETDDPDESGDPADPSDPSTPGDGDTDTPNCGGNHQYTSVVTEPTCTEKGYTTYTCSVCGDTYTGDDVEISHNYTEKVVAATCSAGGYTEHTCSVCGDTYKDNETPAGQHNYKLVFRSFPTLTVDGATTYRCQVCDHRVKSTLRYKDIVPNAYAGNSANPVAIGVDVSYHQNDYDPSIHINFPAMKAAGIDYVILRAGYSGKKDTCFETNYADARAAGLDIGVYIYTYADTVAEAEQDARDLLTWIAGKQFEYPIYFDLENDAQKAMSTTALKNMTNAFFEIMQSNGYFTSLYIYENFLQNYLDTAYTIETYDIWYARYLTSWQNWNFSASGVPAWRYDSQYGAGNRFGMWQFTDSSIINGVYGGGGGYNASGVVDTNICYKDYPSIIKKYGFNGYPVKPLDGELDGATGDTGGNNGGTTDTKTYVWIIANSLNVRSAPDFSGDNVIGTAKLGDKFEVLERNTSYTKIVYNGGEAYISANAQYVSFTQP